MMRRAAARVDDEARLDSTWARVESVMSGYLRVVVSRWHRAKGVYVGMWEGHVRAYVKAMDSSPPPAPARACATLSLCWATALEGALCVDSASLSVVVFCADAMFVSPRSLILSEAL